DRNPGAYLHGEDVSDWDLRAEAVVRRRLVDRLIEGMTGEIGAVRVEVRMTEEAEVRFVELCVARLARDLESDVDERDRDLENRRLRCERRLGVTAQAADLAGAIRRILDLGRHVPSVVVLIRSAEPRAADRLRVAGRLTDLLRHLHAAGRGLPAAR